MIKLLPFLFLFSAALNAQTLLSGRVVGSDSSVVSYATVYVSKQNAGCYSDSNGYFSIRVPKGAKVLEINALGYKKTSVEWKDPKAFLPIYLDTIEWVLAEVTIRPRARLLIKPGKEQKGSLKACSEYSYQIGLYMPNLEQAGGEIQRISVLLENPNLPEAVLRIRLYQVDADLKPDQDLLLENVLLRIPPTRKKKLISIDLSHYHVRFPGNGVVVVVEWLKIPENRYLSTTDSQLGADPCYGPILGLSYNTRNQFVMWSKRDDGDWIRDPFGTHAKAKGKQPEDLVPHVEIEVR